MGEKIYGCFKMKELKKCPVCSSNKIKFLFNGEDKLLGVPGRFSLFKCWNCEAIFINPQPSYKELEKHYSSDRYYSLKRIQPKEKSRKVRLRIFLYKLYFNNIYKNPFMKILFYPLKFIIRSTIIKKDAKLLDIGCGSGQFLYEMRELGLNVAGIEPGDFDNDGNKKYNLNIENSDLIKAGYSKESFDIVTMNHVLEHINNPFETISEIKRILKKNGIFIIGVPNTNSIAKRIFGKNWIAFDVPRHLINYSKNNLTTFLYKNGFKVLKIRYNSRPNQFSISLMYTLNIRNKFIENLLNLIFLPLTWIVNSLKKGDAIEILTIKI
jgi:2-polyprenyl-3-methyl-5-hydroxy-6-metoxy-1,4-benzoquinol methylase